MRIMEWKKGSKGKWTGKVSVGKIDSMESGSSEVQREVNVEDGR